MGRRQERGFVLIIVLAVLGILSYLALNLVSHSRLYRQLSLHGVWTSQARLAARSGLEKAVAGSLAQVMASAPQAFPKMLWSGGDDRNRNGVQDGWETASSGVFSRFVPLELDPTPSMALEDPLNPGRSLLISTEGVEHGVSWRSGNGAQLALFQVSQPGLYLNGGVAAGEGAEGSRYAARYGTVYASNQSTHPFNRPMVNMLNAWGNYHKYKAMVRPIRTYTYTSPVDSDINIGPLGASGPLASFFPYGAFDRFNPSGNHVIPGLVSETPLGERLLAERPVGGYKSIKRPLEIVAEYVNAWRDRSGTWRYADGAAIPAVTPALVKNIQEEFSQWVTLHHHGGWDWVYTREPATAIFLPNDPTAPLSLSDFDKENSRRRLCAGFFKVDSVRTQLNSVPESLLAATVYSVRDVKYRRYEPHGPQPMALMDVNAYQCENNHPCNYAYSGRTRISGNPLYSMTESIQWARDLILRRSPAPQDFSLAPLRSWFSAWGKGYDAKHIVASRTFRFTSTQPGAMLNHVDYYYDWATQHFRGSLLFQLINPNSNLNSLVWDEAMPGRLDNSVMALTDQAHMLRNPKFAYMFDKLDPHERGNSLDCNGGSYRIDSLGYCVEGGRKLAQARLSTHAKVHDQTVITSQKDFDEACRDPITQATDLGKDWISYPESGGLLADYDGHLALKPRLQICPLGQGPPSLRCKLSGQEPDPTATEPPGYWPRGDRVLMGPSENPARGKFLNSLNPEPSTPITSLIPSSVSLVDAASDLMPGGGIRMSPWNNSPARDGNNPSLGLYPNRREALLVLRNNKVAAADDDNYPSSGYTPGSPDLTPALMNPQEGAVSFYFKPRFTPQRKGLKDAGHCLFYTNFVIQDEESMERLLNLGGGVISPVVDKEPYGAYHAHLRLAWGSLPWQNTGIYYQFNSLPYVWPYVQPFYIGGVQVPHQGGTQPILFSDMTGVKSPSGEVGYLPNYVTMFGFLDFVFGVSSLPNGDGIQGHFGSMNPYTWETLTLEMIFTKFAAMDPAHHGANNINHQLMNSTYPDWNSDDLMSTTASAFARWIDRDKPLYLMDTMHPTDVFSSTGFHTVRKAFYLSHPYDMRAGATRGRGPVDSRRNPQFLIQPGRWNHIFLAWRNMWDLLNDNSPHKGGCLAVYVNGTFNKFTPSGNFGKAGLFLFQDHFNGFITDAFPSVVPYSQTGDYTDTAYYTRANTEYREGVYTFPSVPPSVPPGYVTADFIPTALWNSTLIDYGYCNPAEQARDVRKTDLFERFPPRFYFGFEPTTQKFAVGTPAEHSAYHPSFITWGSYMDIQIFPKADDGMFTPDGGFAGVPAPELQDGFSIFTHTTSSPTLVYPSLINPSLGRIFGVTWSAYLPEFHNFWDDQSLPMGPDNSDSQFLVLDVMQGAVNRGSMVLDQRPSIAPTHHIRFLSPWDCKIAEDLRLELRFRGPPKVMSTPLIDEIAVIHRSGSARFSNFIWE